MHVSDLKRPVHNSKAHARVLNSQIVTLRDNALIQKLGANVLIGCRNGGTCDNGTTHS